MRSTIKVCLLFVLVLFTVSLACQVPGISPQSDAEGLQSTIYVQQTQLAEQGGSSQAEQQSTAAPEGELPPADTGGQQPGGTASQGDFEFLGQIGGSSVAVAVDGDTACLGEGPRLVTLDVSDPAAPRRIGQSEVLPGLVMDVQMDGRYAYAVSLYGGLHVLELSNPADPRLVSSIKPENPGCRAVVLADGLAYLACNPSGLFIADISSPENPVALSSGKLPGVMTSLALVGHYIYGIDVNSQGLVAIDVSDPRSPEKVGVFTVRDVPEPQHESYSFSSVRPCGKWLCLAAAQDGLVVLDLTDPASPAFAGRYDTQVASGLFATREAVFVVDDMDGLHVVGLSDPTRPEGIGRMPTSVGGFEFSVQEGDDRGMAVWGETLYITDQAYGLTVVDISQPENPRRVGHYETPVPDWLFGVKVRDDYAYVIGRTSGFRVVDVADPARMAEVSHDNSRKNVYLQNPRGLEVIGDYAYIADSNYPFHVYDISDPASPVQVGAVFDDAAPDGATDVVVAGQTAYLSGWGGKDAFYPGRGLWVVDIGSPNNPQAAGFVDLPNREWSLAVSGSTLYALDGMVDDKDSAPLSLRVLDISDPFRPVEAGEVMMEGMAPGMPTAILVERNRLYANLMMPVGVRVFDISNPLQPVAIPGPAMSFSNSPGMAKAGDYLFVGGTIVYDVSNPAQPVIAGAVTDMVGAWECDVVGDRVYVATQKQGLYVYRFKPLR